MTGFPADTQAAGAVVAGVTAPGGGTLAFSPDLTHYTVGHGWATWSNGYTGDVYATGGAESMTFTLPSGAEAFYFYAEPDQFATFDVTATAQDGTTSGPVAVAGQAGATYFGFYTSGSTALTTVTVTSSTDFAVGEFGISAGCAGAAASPVSSAPHAAVAFSGSCFAPGERVDALVDTEAGAVLVGYANADSTGSVSSSFQLPAQFVVPAATGGSPTQILVPVRAGQPYQLNVIGTHSGNGLSAHLQYDSSFVPSVAGLKSGDACSANPQAPPPTSAPLPGPLHAYSRWIVNSNTLRVKLVSVNWYGAEEADFVPGGLDCQNVATIAAEVRTSGFNSVRLPFSNAMLEENPPLCSPTTLDLPCVDPGFVRSNPSLATNALGFYREVIAALGQQGIMVVLDDHTTDAQWAPDGNPDRNAIWWGGQLWDDLFNAGNYDTPPKNWPVRENAWRNDWVTMATLFAGQANVVGVDLRNEPNEGTGPPYGQHMTWVTGPGGPLAPANIANWAVAAEYAGNAVLAVDRNLLVMVDGLNFSGDLTAVSTYPLDRVPRTNPQGIPAANLVYAPHEYSGDPTAWGDNWGYILTQGQSYTAPIWVGEWGDFTSQPNTCPNSSFRCTFISYLQQADIDWSWWPLNGVHSDAGSSSGSNQFKAWFEVEPFGLTDTSWNIKTGLDLFDQIRPIQACTQFPIPTIGCAQG
jgi:endoglucanase